MSAQPEVQRNTISQIVLDIHSLNSDADLDAVFNAYRDRKRTLAAAQAAEIKVGDTVRVKGIRPAYLKGLIGVVDNPTAFEPGGKSVTVVLDETSTRMISLKRHVPEGTTNYRLSGVPKVCLEVI